MTHDHNHWMREALAEAKRAAERGEVPVGSVVVVGDQMISRAHNLRETSQDPTAHAEMLALRTAADSLKTWRLTDARVYITLEPCPMCAGALVNARVAEVIWGCDDPKAGATRTLYNIGTDSRLNHRFAITSGVLANECSALLTNFFSQIRASNQR